MDSSRAQAPPLIDPAEVCKAYHAMVQPGQVIEVRALQATVKGDRYPATYSGYLDNVDDLVKALASITSAKGIYITPNPVNPSLLARAANRIRKTPKGESTSDLDIVRRRWLLIDLDAKRASGISATDAEHDAAIERARAIYGYLRGQGWPEPIVADSGNGAHLVYLIDLPVDDDGLVKTCLESLHERFSDGAVDVDTTVYNPSRIWKMYGTQARKGDNTQGRPWRTAKIISLPDEQQVVEVHLLESLAAEAAVEPPEQHRPAREYRGNGAAFDVEAFITRNGLDVDGPHDWQGQQGAGKRWTFRSSFMCEHGDGAAFMLQHASGAVTAGCHHNSCSWNWGDLRGTCEPNGNGPRPNAGNAFSSG